MTADDRLRETAIHLWRGVTQRWATEADILAALKAERRRIREEDAALCDEFASGRNGNNARDVKTISDALSIPMSEAAALLSGGRSTAKGLAGALRALLDAEEK